MKLRGISLLTSSLVLCVGSAFGSGDGDTDLAAAQATALKTFKDQISPFISTYCIRCHGEKKKKAGVTFEYAVKTPSSSTFRPLWKKAVTNIKSHDMPPSAEEK